MSERNVDQRMCPLRVRVDIKAPRDNKLANFRRLRVVGFRFKILDVAADSGVSEKPRPQAPTQMMSSKLDKLFSRGSQGSGPLVRSSERGGLPSAGSTQSQGLLDGGRCQGTDVVLAAWGIRID
jgi:hypothetical protein